MATTAAPAAPCRTRRRVMPPATGGVVEWGGAAGARRGDGWSDIGAPPAVPLERSSPAQLPSAAPTPLDSGRAPAPGSARRFALLPLHARAHTFTSHYMTGQRRCAGAGP
ncbi:hypothetical protein XAB3213_300021 [Xanthomonas citri pv. bilvae]|nr:hypothetical protein XAB3213_300021 [Xanthomonas citri pv. bilvae]